MKEHCFHIMFVLHAYHLDHCFKVINCPSLMSHYAAVLLVTGLTCFLCRINLLYNLPVHLKLWKIDMLSLCEKKVFDWAIFFYFLFIYYFWNCIFGPPACLQVLLWLWEYCASHSVIDFSTNGYRDCQKSCLEGNTMRYG